MPIEGVSEIVRLPRLGKIHLGIKITKEETGTQYPRPTDYFVVPPEVVRVYGEKPAELDIMFPTEDVEQFAQQWLRAYSLTQGLVCKGDGITARRKIDTRTGAIASHETKEWEWHETACYPQECPEYTSKHCRRVLNLQFLLPRVPGLGCYQIDTSSFYSIVNINSMIKMLKGIFGRCSMIPLTLALGHIEVSPPGISKKTVYIMHIKKDLKLTELAQIAQLAPARVLLPEPETEQPPEDLFSEEILVEQEQAAAPAEEEIPVIDEEQLKGWQSVKNTVKELGLTESQVSKWFKRYGIETSLYDFDRDFQPPQLSNAILSHFQSSLEAYREKLNRA